MDLRVYCGICDSGRLRTLSRAASVLCITWPALTKQIKLLENRLRADTVLCRTARRSTDGGGAELLLAATALVTQSRSLCIMRGATEPSVTGAAECRVRYFGI